MLLYFITQSTPYLQLYAVRFLVKSCPFSGTPNTPGTLQIFSVLINAHYIQNRTFRTHTFSAGQWLHSRIDNINNVCVCFNCFQVFTIGSHITHVGENVLVMEHVALHFHQDRRHFHHLLLFSHIRVLRISLRINRYLSTNMVLLPQTVCAFSTRQ